MKGRTKLSLKWCSVSHVPKACWIDFDGEDLSVIEDLEDMIKNTL
jgi:hypothetical protein